VTRASRPCRPDRARRRWRDGDAPRAGFGLIEAILALAIAGLVLAAVTEIAGRTLRSWNAGFAAVAAVERTDVALGRISADLASLLPVRLATADDPNILFAGDAQGMAFTALTPFDRSNDGIAVVEIGVETSGDGAVLSRRLRRGRDRALRSGDRVVLLSGPLDLAFSYRDQAGRRLATWTKPGEVPRGVIVTLRGRRGGGGLPVEVMVPIPVAIAVSCLIEVPEPSTPKARQPAGVRGPGGEESDTEATGGEAQNTSGETPDDRRKRCATSAAIAQSRDIVTSSPSPAGAER
jgi:general secretion pathway protein J